MTGTVVPRGSCLICSEAPGRGKISMRGRCRRSTSACRLSGSRLCIAATERRIERRFYDVESHSAMWSRRQWLASPLDDVAPIDRNAAVRLASPIRPPDDQFINT